MSGHSFHFRLFCFLAYFTLRDLSAPHPYTTGLQFTVNIYCKWVYSVWMAIKVLHRVTTKKVFLSSFMQQHPTPCQQLLTTGGSLRTVGAAAQEHKLHKSCTLVCLEMFSTLARRTHIATQWLLDHCMNSLWVILKTFKGEIQIIATRKWIQKNSYHGKTNCKYFLKETSIVSFE